jgi:hypothetical protein
VSGDVGKWVGKGAKAARALAIPHTNKEEPWDKASLAERMVWVSHAEACIRAFLAAAEADGVVLVRVPDAMDWCRTDGPAHGMKTKGWNDCVAAVLAGKVTV